MHLFNGIAKKPNMKVLDVGCGTGGNSIRLSQLNYKVIGVDISQKAISYAKKRVDNIGTEDIDFFVCDIEDLCFIKDSFDICFCGAVLHHFPDLNEVAKELYRVTKRDGKMLAYDPNALHPYPFIVHNILNKAINLKGFSPNERALKPKNLQYPFKNAGFTNFKFDSVVVRTKKAQWRFVRELSYRTLDMTLSGLRKGNMLTMICEKRR